VESLTRAQLADLLALRHRYEGQCTEDVLRRDWDHAGVSALKAEEVDKTIVSIVIALRGKESATAH
jgi:hypothetical protein